MHLPPETPREPDPSHIPAKRAVASEPAPAAKSLTPLNIASEHPIDPKKLTPEEQMALYEKDLKENDWGHQPC